MKRIKKSPPPRYLTIRIQYYPLSKRHLLLPLAGLVLLLYCSLLISYRQIIKEATVLRNQTAKKPVNFDLPLVDFNKFYKDDNQIITHGPRNLKQVALTFDADMTPGMKAKLDS
ncbi:MAG TPA: hypothetical protein VF810_03970, partial [Patescibacteria group bacterium]